MFVPDTVDNDCGIMINLGEAIKDRPVQAGSMAKEHGVYAI